MANVTVQSRLTPELKQRAESIFSAIGMGTSDAIRVFLQQSVNIVGLPFQPVAKLQSTETIESTNELLIAGASLPDANRVVNWRAHRECHITPDWLLIYRNKIIEYVGTGSHCDLFG